MRKGWAKAFPHRKILENELIQMFFYLDPIILYVKQVCAWQSVSCHKVALVLTASFPSFVKTGNSFCSYTTWKIQTEDSLHRFSAKSVLQKHIQLIINNGNILKAWLNHDITIHIINSHFPCLNLSSLYVFIRNF